MASILDDGAIGQDRTGLSRRMSTHLAAALVIFSLLQIFIVAKMGGSLVLHLGIMVAIALFAVGARTLEHRWAILSRSGLPEGGLMVRFRQDLTQLWIGSIGGALMWIPVCIIFNAVFH